MYTHVYIKAHQAILNVYIQKYMYPQANAAPRYKKWAHQPIYNKKKDIHHAPLMVPLSRHHLLLPQAVAAHHHLPQAVVVHPLQDPPAPAAGVHSS
jgi:hypothetical protein